MEDDDIMEVEREKFTSGNVESEKDRLLFHAINKSFDQSRDKVHQSEEIRGETNPRDRSY